MLNYLFYIMIALFFFSFIFYIFFAYKIGIQNLIGLILITTGLFLYCYQLEMHFFSITDDIDMLVVLLGLVTLPIAIGLTIINTKRVDEIRSGHILKNFFGPFFLMIIIVVIELLQCTVENISVIMSGSLEQSFGGLIPNLPQLPDFPDIPIFPDFEETFEFVYDFDFELILPGGWWYLLNLAYIIPIFIIVIVTIFDKILKMEKKDGGMAFGRYFFIPVAIFFLTILMLFYFSHSDMGLPIRFINYEL